MSLKDQIEAAVRNPDASLLIAEAVLEPALGPSEPLVPPTYSRPASDSSKDPYFAVTDESFVPRLRTDGDGAGWHSDVVRDHDGRPVLAPRVEVDSVGSQATRAEQALWDRQSVLGVQLPGLVIQAPPTDAVDEIVAQAAVPKKVDKGAFQSALRDVLVSMRPVSTWSLAHRHVDAWVRYASDPDQPDQQVWAGGRTMDLITSASVQNADVLYRHFANAAIYGFWLSSGVAQRHRMPRTYASEIAGYGAWPVRVAATKLDPMGGAPNTLRLDLGAAGITVSGKNKPSDLGFGQVPTSPATRAFVCETVLQQSSVSLPLLRSLQFQDDDGSKSVAAATVLALLAIAGREFANADGFLRSGCSLVQSADHWGVRYRGSGGRSSFEPLEVGGIDGVAEQLRFAVGAAEQVGLSFADPIPLQMSPAELAVVAARVGAALEGSGTGED